VKRRALVRHLRKRGCELVREGANHSLFVNPVGGALSTVPRHSDINDILARKICSDLEIPLP
jgi:predicted RNA binding protein YcfA (HicA-like mRNA interferase family)